jgi:hypothetical protein
MQESSELIARPAALTRYNPQIRCFFQTVQTLALSDRAISLIDLAPLAGLKFEISTPRTKNCPRDRIERSDIKRQKPAPSKCVSQGKLHEPWRTYDLVDFSKGGAFCR